MSRQIECDDAILLADLRDLPLPGRLVAVPPVDEDYRLRRIARGCPIDVDAVDACSGGKAHHNKQCEDRSRYWSSHLSLLGDWHSIRTCHSPSVMACGLWKSREFLSCDGNSMCASLSPDLADTDLAEAKLRLCERVVRRLHERCQ